jgi:hypothetical protein
MRHPRGKLVVRRSALRMWLLAVAGVPLTVLGIDVLYQRRVINFFSELVFTSDPQLVEPRDRIWAVAMLLVGLSFSVWGLKELIAPRSVLEADFNGLRLRLRGPFRPGDRVPWDQVEDVDAEVLDDEGDRVSVLLVEVKQPEKLPVHPYGARWLDKWTLAILAADWDRSPRYVADAITELALTAARLETDEAPLD